MPRKKSQQLTLMVKLFAVRGWWGDQVVQAPTPAAAKYQVYKLGREAGYFSDGFREFLAHGFTARELRR